MSSDSTVLKKHPEGLSPWTIAAAAAAGVEAGLEEARVFPRVVLNMADIVGGSSVDGGSKTGLKREVSEDVGI